MNNELATDLNEVSRVATGSASLINHSYQERLQNRINTLLNREASIKARLEANNQRVVELRRHVDEASSQLGRTRDVSDSFERALRALWNCLHILVNSDVCDAMKNVIPVDDTSSRDVGNDDVIPD